MKKGIQFLLMVQLIWLGSCASYNPGKYADVLKGEHPGGTPINADVNSDFSPNPFVYVNITFGNKSTERWTRIKKIRFTNIGGIEGARLIVGPDLFYWSEGVRRKVAIDNHNSQVFWGSMAGIMAAGAAVSSSKGNFGLAKGLAGGALFTAGVMDINAIADQATSLEMSALVPPTHIYRPFSVPPGLYISRWAVFEVPQNKEIEFLEFEVEYLSGKTAHYKVQIDGVTRYTSRGKK